MKLIGKINRRDYEKKKRKKEKERKKNKRKEITRCTRSTSWRTSSGELESDKFLSSASLLRRVNGYTGGRQLGR